MNKLFLPFLSAESVFFHNIIHILVSSAGKVNENRAPAHLSCKLHPIGHSMCALNGGDDPLFPCQGIKNIHCGIITDIGGGTLAIPRSSPR